MRAAGSERLKTRSFPLLPAGRYAVETCAKTKPKGNRWISLGEEKKLTLKSECHEICLFTASSAEAENERGSDSDHHQSSEDRTRPLK